MYGTKKMQAEACVSHQVDNQDPKKPGSLGFVYNKDTAKMI